MTWKELVSQLKTMLANKDVTLGQVVGEMGISADALAGETGRIESGYRFRRDTKEGQGSSGVLPERWMS